MSVATNQETNWWQMTTELMNRRFFNVKTGNGTKLFDKIFRFSSTSKPD